MMSASLRPALACAVLLLALLLPTAAGARVVGLVFDDSRSMLGTIETPAFGAQILAASLDGRPGADRLLTLRMSDARKGIGPTDQPIGSAAALQATVDEIRTRFNRPDGGTPFESVARMLDAIVAALTPGEAGFLIILTDGDFDPDPPAAAALRARFEQARARLAAKGARLTVDFLAIGLNRPPAFFTTIDGECVRPLLLDIFNADESSPPVISCLESHIATLPGYHNVRSMDDLLPALRGIISAISGTERHLGAAFVTTDGATVTIDSPLAIARLVTIATADQPDTPPLVLDTSFPRTSEIVTRQAMSAADSASPVRKAGTTTQFRFSPRPLPAGRHTLSFDQPVGADLQLVLQPAATVALEIATADGTPVQPDATGVLPVVVGADYQVIATIEDETPQGRRVVPLDSLRGAVAFSGLLQTDADTRPLALARDGSTDRAIGTLRLDAPGNLVLSADAAIADFLVLSGKPLHLSAFDGRIRFDTRLTGTEPCPGCAADTVRTTFEATPQPRTVAEVTLTPSGALAGTATLDRSGVPGWLTVRDAAGQPLADGATLPVVPGTPIRLTLDRPARSCAGIMASVEPIALALMPMAPLSGAARVEGRVEVHVAPAGLGFTGASGPTDAEGRLSQTLAGLARGSGSLHFALAGACDPPDATTLEVQTSTWLTGATVTAAADGTLAVTPTLPGWCACLGFLDWGTGSVTLTYRAAGGMQTATATAPLRITPTLRDLIGCVLAVLALVWLAGVLLVTARTLRFPRGSVAAIHEHRQALPRYQDLRGYNLTLLKALFWPVRPLFGSVIPHEQATVEGLPLVARRGGVLLRITPGQADLVVRGQSLHEMLEVTPTLRTLPLNWNEEIEIPGRPRLRIRLLRTMTEAGQP